MTNSAGAPRTSFIIPYDIPGRPEGQRRTARRLLLSLLVLTVALPLILVLRSRQLPTAVDVASASPETAPETSRERPPAGILRSAVIFAAPELGASTRARLLYLDLLADELLLLLGCWCLACRYFPSPFAAFFVGVGALGSTLLLDRSWLNVHSIAALPLLIHLGQGFLEDGSRKKFLLAGNLAILQSVGGPAGLGLAAPAAAAIFLAGQAVVLREPLLPRLRALEWRRSDPLVLLGVGATGIPVLLQASGRTGAVAASAPLHELLVYAGLSSPLKYVDFLLGLTPSPDWSLYSGALTLGFAFIALRSLPRTTVVRMAIALPAGLLLLGTMLWVVASFVPFLRPPDGACFGTPVLRLFVIFLSGAGLQRILSERRPAPVLQAGVLLGCAALLLAVLSWAASTRNGATPLIVRDLLAVSSLMSGGAGGILILWSRSRRAAPLALTLLLILHPLDAFSWKFRVTWLETLPPLVPHGRLDSLDSIPRYVGFHQLESDPPDPAIARRRGQAWPFNGRWGADPADAGSGFNPAGFRPRSPLQVGSFILIALNGVFWLFAVLQSLRRLEQGGRA